MKAVLARTRIAVKNILFATDFSTAADLAMPFATQIAKRYGAKVYGVHVNSSDDYTGVAPNAWAAMAEAAEKETKEDARRLNEQLRGIEHEVVIGEGNIWEVVCNLIKEKQIDLVVVGTRGRTGLGKALLGSVAEQILRQAPCPVLTVGPRVTLEPELATKMHEILYATDLTVEFPVAAPYAISLAQENQAHLVMLHVAEDREAGDLVQPEEVAGSMLSKLQKLVPQEAELWCEPACLVEQGESAEKILDVANRRNADLIVLGARPAKGRLGAVTHLNGGTVHKVVSQAKCPVLTVRG
jgi:nucleotide-binding universal stress UspA family protein